MNERSAATSSEQALWQSVLLMAVEDALYSFPINSQSCHNVKIRDKDKLKAREYFSKAVADFQTVCHLAGLDPIATKEHVCKQITTLEAQEQYERDNPKYLQLVADQVRAALEARKNERKRIAVGLAERKVERVRRKEQRAAEQKICNDRGGGMLQLVKDKETGGRSSF